MKSGTIFRVFAVVLLIALAFGAGATVYNAGIAAGVQQAAAQAPATGGTGTPAAVPYAYGPYHWGGGPGFGFFGIFFWILGLFLIFGLVRAAFGWGGPGRWGPGGPGVGRREMIEEWHREMHRDEAGDPARRGDRPPAGAS